MNNYIYIFSKHRTNLHLLCKITWKYEDHSESNASYFIILAHDVRGGCWWYGSRGWTFPPIFHYMLLLCDRWQLRGSLTEQCLTWKHVWSRDVEWNSSMMEKPHPLTFINACWMFLETKQWMWAQWGDGWCVLGVVTMAWKMTWKKQATFWMAMHSYRSTKWRASLSSSAQIS